jgi:hypothetical protein
MPAPHDERRAVAMAEFKRMIVWIAVVAVFMTVAALLYIAQEGPLHLHLVIATIGGVFLSVLLGSGLFAAAFFSDKSGHDEAATLGKPEAPGDKKVAGSKPPLAK